MILTRYYVRWATQNRKHPDYEIPYFQGFCRKTLLVEGFFDHFNIGSDDEITFFESKTEAECFVKQLKKECEKSDTFFGDEVKFTVHSVKL